MKGGGETQADCVDFVRLRVGGWTYGNVAARRRVAVALRRANATTGCVITRTRARIVFLPDVSAELGSSPYLNRMTDTFQPLSQ